MQNTSTGKKNASSVKKNTATRIFSAKPRKSTTQQIPKQNNTAKNISSASTAGYAGSFYLRSGERLNNGRYSIVNVMGFGAFGVAYECFDKNTRRRVVVKEYMPSFLVSRSKNGRDVSPISPEAEINFSIGVDAFIDETKKLSSNGISCVPAMIEFFYQNNTSYVVTELVEGELLKSVIKRTGRLSCKSAVSITTGILQGLRQLNKTGIIHSDICPDNVVVLSDGKIKLLDYNLSDFNKTIYTQRDSGKLRAGYSAIEMYYPNDMEQGPWTDVYAAGATMYKMITGAAVPSAMKRKANECLMKPSDMGIAVTAGAEKAMMNALCLDPKKRTQKPEDFLNDLMGDGYENLTASTSSPEPKMSAVKQPPDGNKILNTVLIVLLIVIIGVVIWLFASGVLTLPQAVTDALGLTGNDSDTVTDTDIETDTETETDYAGDFYSVEEEEDDSIYEEEGSEEYYYSSEEESSEEEYYYSSSEESWDESSSAQTSSQEEYYSSEDESSGSVLDGITSTLSSVWENAESGASGLVSDFFENFTSSEEEYYY